MDKRQSIESSHHCLVLVLHLIDLSIYGTGYLRHFQQNYLNFEAKMQKSSKNRAKSLHFILPSKLSVSHMTLPSLQHL